MKQISLSFALACLVCLSCGVLSVISTVLMTHYAVDSSEKKQSKLNQQKAAAIKAYLNGFLAQELTVLDVHAKSPIIRKALYSANKSTGQVKDYFPHLPIWAGPYQKSLIDLKGKPIYTTPSLPPLLLQDPIWLKALLAHIHSPYIGVHKIDGIYVWCLVTPITDHSGIIGVLSTFIPIDVIEQQISSFLDGIMIEIIKDDKVLTTFGNQQIGKKQLLKWHNAGVDFQFTFGSNTDSTALNQTLYTLSSLIILVLFLTTLFAYFVTYHCAVKPLRSISRATGELDKGREPILLVGDNYFKEYAHLFKKFSLMSDTISRREQALKSSYDRLSKKNKELIFNESQLIQSEKMACIGVLSAGVAHEINNPISFVKSNLVVLSEYIKDIEQYQQQLAKLLSTEELNVAQQRLAKAHDIDFIINDLPSLLKSSISGIEKVNDIVQSLKTFAKADDTEKSKTDINLNLNTTLNILRNELSYKCKFHIKLDSLPIIYAYPSKLHQVFMNLLINAGQSIQTRGDIFIKTYQQGLHIVIDIEDTGCGIEPEVLPHIFTPFYTSKPVGEGTGLGLSICYEIIKQHKGRIEVSSEIGKGSCFSVFIPVELS